MSAMSHKKYLPISKFIPGGEQNIVGVPCNISTVLQNILLIKGLGKSSNNQGFRQLNENVSEHLSTR